LQNRCGVIIWQWADAMFGVAARGLIAASRTDLIAVGNVWCLDGRYDGFTGGPA